jgi:ABC-type phosphate transport system substrate-binding protein
VFKSIKFRLAALAVATTFGANAFAADVTGAGASFVYPVMSKWSADYAKSSGKKVNYHWRSSRRSSAAWCQCSTCRASPRAR